MRSVVPSHSPEPGCRRGLLPATPQERGSASRLEDLSRIQAEPGQILLNSRNQLPRTQFDISPFKRDSLPVRGKDGTEYPSRSGLAKRDRTNFLERHRIELEVASIWVSEPDPQASGELDDRKPWLLTHGLVASEDPEVGVKRDQVISLSGAPELAGIQAVVDHLHSGHLTLTGKALMTRPSPVTITRMNSWPRVPTTPPPGTIARNVSSSWFGRNCTPSDCRPREIQPCT